MRFVVFEAVEVLVALAADVAAVGFFLFHAEGARVRGGGFGVDDGEGAVGVFVQLLVVVAVLLWVDVLGYGCTRRRDEGEGGGAYGFVVFEAVLILVGFFAADDGTAEGFGFFAVEARCRVGQSGHHLLFSYSSRQLAVGAVLAGAEAELCVLLRVIKTTVGTEESFCGFVDA